MTASPGWGRPRWGRPAPGEDSTGGARQRKRRGAQLLERSAVVPYPQAVVVKPQTIRAIDAIAGRVLCWLLTLHRRLIDFSRRGRRPDGPLESILFLKLVEQGATVLAAGAIERAVSRVGRDNVYFCVFAENREILDILDLIPRENVFALRNRTFHLFLV